MVLLWTFHVKGELVFQYQRFPNCSEMLFVFFGHFLIYVHVSSCSRYVIINHQSVPILKNRDIRLISAMRFLLYDGIAILRRIEKQPYVPSSPLKWHHQGGLGFNQWLGGVALYSAKSKTRACHDSIHFQSIKFF